MSSILIIDDSKAMRMIVARAVRQAGYGDYQILEASNGLEGVAMIRSAAPDLVLCDWNMPEMNGLDVLKTISSDPSPPPLGFVTSEGTGEIRAQAVAEGARFFIIKPFTAEAFTEALSGVLRK